MRKLISADDHLVESATLWEDRLPMSLREVGPRWDTSQAHPTFLLEGRPATVQTRAIAFVKGNEERIARGEYAVNLDPNAVMWPTDLLPVQADPAVRATAFRELGIVGSVNFPTVPRFAGTLFLELKDRVLADLCVKAWNDWLFEEWCAADSDLYIPMTLIQLWDPPAAAEEVRRNAERGGRAISMCEEPSSFGLPSFYSEEWAPLWTALQETETVACMHIGTRGSVTELPRCSPRDPSRAGRAERDDVAHQPVVQPGPGEVPESEVLPLREWPRLDPRDARAC